MANGKLQIGVGFHAATACYCDGIGGYIRKMAVGGQTLSTKCVDGTSGMMDFQAEIQRGSHGYGVYRCLKDYDVPMYGTDIPTEVAKYIKKINDNWPPELDKNIFHVEMINEPNKIRTNWIGYFLCELADRMMEQGYKFCGPGWSTGEPEPEHNRTPGMLAWFRKIAENPDRLAHSVHEYALDNESGEQAMKDTIPYLMGRCRDVNAACYENGIAPPPIFITEFGWNYRDAPSWPTGVPQIIDMLHWYLEHVPNVKMFSLWALDRGSMWSDLGKTINSYMDNLSDSIINKGWPQPKMPTQPDLPVIDPPTSPIVKPKIVIVKMGQEHGADAWSAASAYAYSNYKRTITASLDDLLSMLRGGNQLSYAIIVDPEKLSQKDAITILKINNFEYKVIYLDDTQPEPHSDLFIYRPCDTDRVTQVFGANPENYAQFGLPGHDGIDYGVPSGYPYYSVRDGVVVHASNMRPSGGLSSWGYHVIVRHEVNNLVFHTVYAHGQRDLLVSKGDIVKAGDKLALSGNTGNSFGYHLHLGLLWATDPGNGFPKWTYGYAVNPWPYLIGKSRPPNPTLDSTDFLGYIKGDGRLYEVSNSNGGMERFQTQLNSPNEFWQTKDGKAEQLFYTANSIYRGWDTSPGKNRWYQLQEPKGASKSKWLPRYMRVGEMFSVGLWVQFFNWDCSISAENSGQVYDTRKFVAKYDTWKSRAGVTLENVIEIEWVNGGETYFYALNYGLVGWERTHQDPNTPAWSAISEIHAPGQRPDNKVELPQCLQ